MAPPNNLNIRVSTIDSVITFNVNSKIKPQGLFDQIALTLGLRETWYFGLRYKVSGNTYRWVDMAKKITKQGIKIDAPDKMDLQLRFKYYPEDVDKDLIQYVTIKLFYLQLKSDILEGHTYCPAENAVVLASYALQVQNGDYDPDIHRPGSINAINLLPSEVIQKHNVSNEEWEEKIVDFYKTHQGLDREEAMLEYCKVVEGLDTYGITYFSITNSKGTTMLLGVSAIGINVYETSDKLNPKFSFPWSEIQKLKKTSGSITVKLKKINFVAKSLDAKHIYDLCNGTNDMYLRSRKADTLEVQQMRNQRGEEKKSRAQEKEVFQKEIQRRKAIEEDRRRVVESIDVLNTRNTEMEGQLIDARMKIDNLEKLLEQKEADKKQLQIELESLQALWEEHKDCEGYKGDLAAQIQNKELEVMKLQEIIDVKEDQAKCLEEEILHLQKTEEISEDTAILNGYGGSSSSSSSSSSDSEDEQRVPEEIKKIAEEEYVARRVQIKIDSGSETITTIEETPLPLSSTGQSAETKMIELSKSTLMRELKTRLDHTKNDEFETVEDKIHRDNLNSGRQKFVTLREIRFGTIKRKIEEFEAL